MEPVDLAEHARILDELMPPECRGLKDFCMERMAYGQEKYEQRAENSEPRDLAAETREEIADGINRLAMMIAQRETRAAPRGELLVAADYLLRAYWLLK